MVTYNDGEYDYEIEQEVQDASPYRWVVLDEDGSLLAWFDNRADAEAFEHLRDHGLYFTD